jgi:ankyrin repeat protein
MFSLSSTIIVVGAFCVASMVGCGRSDVTSNQASMENSPLSPLLEAAKRGDASKVKSLLDLGGDPNAADGQGVSAIQYAASSGQTAVVQELLSRGANIRASARNGSTALHVAAVDRDVRLVDLLLAAGADVNAQTVDGVTPLMASLGSPYSDTKISLALIRAGADVNIADSEGRTALWISVTESSDEVLEELLKRGANPNVQPKTLGFPGYTPLHMAAMNGATKMVELLVRHGADPGIVNSKGETPLDITNVKFDGIRRILSSYSKDSH